MPDESLPFWQIELHILYFQFIQMPYLGFVFRDQMHVQKGVVVGENPLVFGGKKTDDLHIYIFYEVIGLPLVGFVGRSDFGSFWQVLYVDGRF